MNPHSADCTPPIHHSYRRFFPWGGVLKIWPVTPIWCAGNRSVHLPSGAGTHYPKCNGWPPQNSSWPDCNPHLDNIPGLFQANNLFFPDYPGNDDAHNPWTCNQGHPPHQSFYPGLNFPVHLQEGCYKLLQLWHNGWVLPKQTLVGALLMLEVRTNIIRFLFIVPRTPMVMG